MYTPKNTKPNEEKLDLLINMAWWLYVLHGISHLFSLGAFSWIPLIISYMTREKAAGTFVYSHHTWQIRSFWLYLICVLIIVSLSVYLTTIFLFFFVVIFLLPLWGVVWVWKAYRLTRGFLRLQAGLPMPA